MAYSENKKTSTRTYGGLSSSERQHERRERFLEAGLELFGTLGVRGTTVRALCKQAGLTERYFYESFADTEALFCAVYETQTGKLRDFLIAALPTLPDTMEERVRAALNLYYTWMRDARLVRIINLECLAGSPRLQAMNHDNIRSYADMAVAMIRADNPDLDIDKDYVSSLAIAVNGACYTLAIQWMLDGYTVPQDIIVSSCFTVVLGTVRELRNQTQKPA